MTKVTSPYLLMLDSISDRFVTIKRIKKGSMIMVSGKCAGVVIYWRIYFIYRNYLLKYFETKRKIFQMPGKKTAC